MTEGKRTMKCSVSNLAWQKERDEEVYRFLEQSGVDGLEIAPSRLFGETPYEDLKKVRAYRKRLWEMYGLSIVSMQSVWFGRKENMFVSSQERETLREYTKKAICFAREAGCGNIVFGCPKNRRLGEGKKKEQALPSALEFFAELGEYAAANDTVLALEANPPVYGTDFLNTTQEAISFLKRLQDIQGDRILHGLGLNLDIGTILINREDCKWIRNDETAEWIHHVHISEPELAAIKARGIHREIADMLRSRNYGGYISIEMKGSADVEAVKSAVSYVKRLIADGR